MRLYLSDVNRGKVIFSDDVDLHKCSFEEGRIDPLKALQVFNKTFGVQSDEVKFLEGYILSHSSKGAPIFYLEYVNIGMEEA